MLSCLILWLVGILKISNSFYERFTYYEIYSFKLYNLIVFSILKKFYSHHYSQFLSFQKTPHAQ